MTRAKRAPLCTLGAHLQAQGSTLGRGWRSCFLPGVQSPGSLTKPQVPHAGDTVNVSCERKCWWDFWCTVLVAPFNVAAGPERRIYLKLPHDFIVRGSLESTSARPAYGATLILMPSLFTRAPDRTKVYSLVIFSLQKRMLVLLFAGNKGSFQHYHAN